MTQMITIPRQTYARLLAEQAPKLVAETTAEGPRTEELSAQIKGILARAEAAGLRLDDDAVAADSRAGEMRAELDTIMPEFIELRDRLLLRRQIVETGRERLKTAMNAARAEVQVPEAEAAMLLGLSAA